MENKALEAGRKALKAQKKALGRENEAELNRLKEELERNNKVELARQLREQVTDIRAYREWQQAKSIDELAIEVPVSQSKLPRRRSNLNDREIPM